MLVPRIIAETDEILVVDKPAGLIVHSDGRTIEPSLADWVAKEYPALSGAGRPSTGAGHGSVGVWVSPQGERVQLNGIVHRLDRTTGGVVLVAKTEEMFAYLKNEFKERRVEKTYRAIVHGHMESESGKIVAEIMRSSEPPRRWYARPCEESENRAAITEWRLLKKLEDKDTGEAVSYVEVQPKTGRTHQIRVHFASIGHPLVGDRLYSERPPLLGFKRPALHAYSILFTLNGKKAMFTAPLPPDFPSL